VERLRTKNWKIILGLAALFLLSGCTKQDLSGFLGLDDSDSSLTPGSDALTVENFVTQNITSESFQLVFDYEGDANNNSVVEAYVCSVGATPGCDPKTGTKVTFQKQSGELVAYVDLTIPPFDSGDLVKFTVEVSDPDGLTGPQEKTGFVIVPHNNDPKLITQLGYIATGSTNDSGSEEYILDMVIDASGNKYLAGYTSGSFGELGAGEADAIIIKLDSDGNLDTSFGGGDGIAQLGQITLGAIANTNDRLYAITLDSDGNVFVAGQTEGSLGEANAGLYDAFVAKLNSSGTLDSTFGGSNGIVQLGNVTVGAGASDGELINAIAIDPSGNIIIAGYTEGSLGEASAGNHDGFVAKLDSSGALDTSFGGGDGIAQFGSVTIGAGAIGSDVVSDMALDASGNIFLFGHTFGALGETNAGSYDLFVAKLDSNGTLDTSFGGSDGIAQLGSSTVGANASSNNLSTALKLDGSGNVFITGRTVGSLGETTAGSYDVFLAKLDSTGAMDTSFGGGDGIAQLGDITIGSDANGGEYSRDIYVDASGNVYLAGETPGDLGETAGTSSDIFIAKFDSTGSLDTSFGSGNGIAQLGAVTMGPLANLVDNVSVLSADSSGNLFFAGHTSGSLGENSAGEYDAYIAQIDTSGTLMTSFGGGDGIAQLGHTTVGGGSSGDNRSNEIIKDASGNTFLVGTTSGSLGEASGGLSDVIVIKFNAYGKLDTTFGGGKGIVQLGKMTIGDGANSYDYGLSFALDASGNILIAGHTSGSLGEASAGSTDIFVAKLNATGALDTSFGGGDGIAQLGNVTVGVAASGTDYAYSMQLDGSGNIYLGGYTYGDLGEANAGGADAYVAKLDSTGALDTSYGGGDGIAHLGNVTVGAAANSQQYPNKIALDGSGNIYITGPTSGNLGETAGGGDDIFIAKLDSNGALDTSFGGGSGIVQLGDTTLGAAADNVDLASAIALDGSGNIFLAGYTNGSLGEANAGNYDAFVLKLDSNGALDTSFGGGDGIAQLGNVTAGATANLSDFVYSIFLDASGNVFIAGATSGSLGEANGGDYDAYVAKLDSSGALDTSFGGGDGITQLGSTTMGTSADGAETINAILIDASGNLFLTGDTTSSLGEPNAGEQDIFICQLTSSGDAP
tara:strand:+ start:5926 stop:9327 length:3402 start_codon:yes stop_codon:yes gene_type:complete